MTMILHLCEDLEITPGDETLILVSVTVTEDCQCVI